MFSYQKCRSFDKGIPWKEDRGLETFKCSRRAPSEFCQLTVPRVVWAWCTGIPGAKGLRWRGVLFVWRSRRGRDLIPCKLRRNSVFSRPMPHSSESLFPNFQCHWILHRLIRPVTASTGTARQTICQTLDKVVINRPSQNSKGSRYKVGPAVLETPASVAHSRD